MIGYQLPKGLGAELEQGDVAPYVFVPGSKGRVRRFAELWDEAQKVVELREFLLYTGTLNGVPVSACSTGIGGTSVALIVDQLIDLGGKYFFRVGVTGPLQPEIDVGDVTIAMGALRNDRISSYYLPPAIPALASYEIVLALAAACQQKQYGFHLGIAATAGSFYCGEGKPGFDGYRQSWMEDIADDFTASGIIDWDTETATLFSLALKRGVRAGRINGVLDNAEGESDPEAEERAVQAALQAVLILDEWVSAPAGSTLMEGLS